MGLKHITWNPNDKGSLVVLSNNNMTASTTAQNSSVRATEGVVEGKWYWENTVNANNSAQIGIMSERLSTSANNISSVDAMFYVSSGVKYNGTSSSYGASYTTNNTIGVALDLDIGTITFYKNGVSQGIAYTTVKNLGKVFPFMCGSNGNPTTITVNFGNESFKYSIPNGYKAYADQYINKTLFQKDGKPYSLKSNGKIYENKMTSNTAPTPLVASASSVYSTTYPAWRAFDGIYNVNGSTATAWVSANGTTSGDITLDFGMNTKVSKVSIAPRNHTTDGIYNAPKNFIVQGSYDGSSYTDLREFTNQTAWTLGNLTTFDLQKVFNYRYYRIKISAITGGGTVTYIAIGQIVYSYDDNIIQSLPSINMKNFIQYGNLELTSLNNDMTSKNYILQDVVSENEQGLWATQLNRKPLSIKFD